MPGSLPESPLSHPGTPQDPRMMVGHGDPYNTGTAKCFLYFEHALDYSIDITISAKDIIFIVGTYSKGIDFDN